LFFQIILFFLLKKATENGNLIFPLIFKQLQRSAFRKSLAIRILILKNSKLVNCGKNPFPTA